MPSMVERRRGGVLNMGSEPGLTVPRAATPHATGLSGCSMRSQQMCLTACVDQHMATRAAHLSAALSRACRYHSYDLPPPRQS
jgi:hypothetical protein